jgi:hypothetical protein
VSVLVPTRSAICVRIKGTYDTDDPSLLSGMLRGPSKVSTFQSQRPVFMVSTSRSNGMDTFRTETGVGRLTTQLEFSLLAVVSSLSSGC